jgi:FMN phosphatase YigB (HAD superfamily)
MKWIICDLDGTLFTAATGEDWYDRNFLIDKTIPEVKNLLVRFKDHGIIFLTGRKEKYRGQTITRLLDENYDVLNNSRKYKLFMRKDNDNRQDWEIKIEVYFIKIKPHFDIAFVIEDRMSVCKMWNELDLFVFCVNQGLKEF